MLTQSWQSVCEHNSTENQLKLIFFFLVWFLNLKNSRFLSYLTKKAINITFYNIVNQYDGSNVFSGHIT